MAINNRIARQIAKQAALATYKALTNVPTRKVAGTRFISAPSPKDLAKIAAAATYNAVVRLAGPMENVPVDFRNIGAALQRKAPAFFKYITQSEYKKSQQVPYDIQTFAQYVGAGGDGESWAKKERWPEITDAIISNVSGPEYQAGLKQYLLSLQP